MRNSDDETVNINTAVQLFNLIMPHCNNIIALELKEVTLLDRAWSKVKHGWKNIEESHVLNKLLFPALLELLKSMPLLKKLNLGNNYHNSEFFLSSLT